VARRAILGCGLVKQYRLAFYCPGLFMASCASHVAMHSLEREACSSVMIEQRRLPLSAVMAVGAECGAIGLDELGAVNIGVATLASRGRHLEIDIDEFGLQIRRFVAIDASYRAVRSDQRKRGLGVVEA